MLKPRQFRVTLVLLFVFPYPADGSWPSDPTTNVAVCTQHNDQSSPISVSDGSGGLITAWVDNRDNRYDLYAQHVPANGVTDPGPAGGTSIMSIGSTNRLSFLRPKIVSDGLGGALVTWTDYRFGSINPEIYAHHVLSNGSVDPAWPVNGSRITTDQSYKGDPEIVADGQGGAIMTWRTILTAGAMSKHVMSTGQIDPTWTPGGVPISYEFNGIFELRTVSDGLGGALVLWTAGDSTLKMQRLRANGTLDPAWPTGGRLIDSGTDTFQPQVMQAGPNNGVTVTWRTSTGQIHAQRVLLDGNLDPSWPPSGVNLCSNPAQKERPSMDSDGAGGAFVAWSDFRSALPGGNGDTFINHVLASGIMDPNWPADGRDLSPTTALQRTPAVRSDGVGGAIVTWIDDRNDLGRADIYAARVLSGGQLDPAWPVDGRAMCLASNTRDFLTLVGSQEGNVIAVWQDNRNSSTTGLDIYCQRVQSNSQLGGAATIVVPPVTISALEHDFEPANPPFQPTAITRDAVTFPGSGYTSSGFTATIAPEDTVVLRFQAPPGKKFVIHHDGSLISQGFFCWAQWYAANDPMTGEDPHTFVFENATGTMPVQTYSFVGMGNGGHVIRCLKQFSISGDFEFTAFQVNITVSRSFAVASQTFGAVQSSSIPSWGVYAQTSGSDQPVLSIVPQSTVSVSDGPKEPVPSLRLASANPSPGPFKLEFEVTRASSVRLEVLDVAGRRVATLREANFLPGRYEATWNGARSSGSTGSGVYFIRYKSGQDVQFQRVVLLR